MKSDLTKEALIQAGVSGEKAGDILEAIGRVSADQPADRAWSHLSRSILAPELPFPVHLLVHRAVFGNWDSSQGPPPAWCPTNLDIENSNIQRFCQTLGISPIASLHAWSVRNREKFWAQVIESLGIEFQTPPTTILDPSSSVESARWLAGAKLNITDNCFWGKKDQTAIIFQPEGGSIGRLSYAELDRISNRFANSLGHIGIRKGEAIAIAMTMTWEAVAAYLGILKAGCVVVSIADSFAPEEIATRLRIARATTVVTQDVILRAGKTLPMYAKVVRAGAARAIVVHAGERPAVDLRPEDRTWADFLVDDDRFAAIAGAPDDPINVLFSSGTTGEPKAIPWNHTTAIKCAMDGYLHQNLRPGEVVAGPTNLGWMMGPWLI
ncbi:MAG: AMP-binding protein, partial [Acidobacteriota bacterium]